MNYQWYPGHMTKAKRMMEENIKLIDLVIEIVDARIPISSRNPDIDSLAVNKARIILLNKSDLADDKITNQWINYFNENNIYCLKLNSRNNSGIKQVNGLIMTACADKIERNKQRGILNRPIRAMVVGIPNVGKSTFINSYAGKASAKTGNKPGVTKGKQWIKLNKNVELLDTPGILWPRFEDQTVGLHLALIGSINDQILNREELAWELIGLLEQIYPGVLTERYGDAAEGETEDNSAWKELSKEEQNLKASRMLERIAKNRACLMKGGELDLARASALLLDEFRSGKLGKLSLEQAQDYTDRVK